MELQPERKPAGVQLEEAREHHHHLCIQLPGNHLAGEKMQVQMMVLPHDGDGASSVQPESDLSSPTSSSPSLSSSSLSLEEELSSSVELSAQHPNLIPERPKTLTESKSLSTNLKWRTCPFIKQWARAKVFQPRRRSIT